MPDLGVGSLSGPLQVVAGKPASSTSTTLLTAFATNVKVLGTSSGGLLALDPGQSFGGIFLPTPFVMGETVPPTAASGLSAIWFDSVTVKLHFLCGATTANAMTIDSSGNLNVAGVYQIAGTSLFATVNTWGALQTFSGGLTVSPGILTLETVPQTSVAGSTTATGYGALALNSVTVSGSNLTAVGYGSQADNNGNGLYNSSFGAYSLYLLNPAAATSQYLTAIGYNAGYNYTGAETNNTILGAGILGTAGETNTLRIGNNLTSFLVGVMAGVPATDYLSIAGRISTANGGTAPTAVTVPASGTAYTPSTTVNTLLFVSGGSVTVIAVNGVTTGLLSGSFYLKTNDTITFTYTSAPVVYQMNA